MRGFLRALVWVSISIAPAAGGVRIVDAVGNKVFSSIQAAVDAAQDGDVLLVGGGTYAGFTVNGKGLSIIARTGDLVNVTGLVTVKNLDAGQDVWLVGVNVAPQYSWALTLESNQGGVRVANCFFTGGNAAGYGSGQIAAGVTNSKDVAFVTCQFRGGNGASHQDFSDGGTALGIWTSRVAVFNALAVGGKGGDSSCNSGHGGDGASLFFGSEMFAAGTTFTGGQGGSPALFCNPDPAIAGNGGSGVLVRVGCTAALLDNQYFPGAAGVCGGCTFPGIPGGTVVGPGSAVHHPGKARRFSCDRILSGGKSLTISVVGLARDKIYALPAASSAHLPSSAPPGVWLIEPPAFFSNAPLGTHPAQGTTNYSFPTLGATSDPPTTAFRRLWFQGYVIDSQGANHLSNPMHVLTLIRESKPDCNGNGINDFVDVVENKNLDINNNLIPDICEP